MKLKKVQNYWKYFKKQCKYQTMFVFISHKTIKIEIDNIIGLWETVVVKPLLFCDISTSKNGNDLLTTISVVSFILACFVLKYSLNFSPVSFKIVLTF